MDDLNLDLSSIINSRTSWAINKLIATKSSIQPFFSLDSFFSSLSDEDIEFLTKETANTNMEDHAASELFLMSLLLAKAEGLATPNDDILVQRFESLVLLISLESMYRKGFVDLVRANMSLGEDAAQLMLAKTTDKGLAFFEQALGE